MKTWNCNEARQISIVDYMAKLDIKPQSMKGGNHWYLLPLREERTPSFKVNTRLNLWYDHGTGEGGNFIDLAIQLHNCTVEELLDKLSSDIELPLSISLPLSADRLVNSHSLFQEEPKLVIESVRPLVSVELTQYFAKRGIIAAIGGYVL